MTNHDQELKRVYEYSQLSILWISIILLIKAHLDLQFEIQNLSLNQSQQKLALPETFPPQTPLQESTIIDGSKYLRGNLIVDGCVLWQQPIGVYQNSCTIFRQLHLDCVHGIYNYSNQMCRCDYPWWGNLCNLHDCFSRGNFSVSTKTCECIAPYTSESMCANKQSVSIDTCETLGTCHGICVNNQCVCNKPGQVGPHCYECASPIIDSNKCPDRTNWGTEFINEQDKFAVCGGGYIEASPDVLIISSFQCKSKNDCHNFLSDFQAQKTICCNPLSLNSNFLESNLSINCDKWNRFYYRIENFQDTGTVFNTGYQRRYMDIINTHNPFSKACEFFLRACLQRAYHQIAISDWPLLRIGAISNQAYTIFLGKFFLGIDLQYSNNYAPAIWDQNLNNIYVKQSTYFSDEIVPSYFILLKVNKDTFCIEKKDIDQEIGLFIYGNAYNLHDFFPGQVAWRNLKRQPGYSQDINLVCRLFFIDLSTKSVLSTDNRHLNILADQNVYMTSTASSVFIS